MKSGATIGSQPTLRNIEMNDLIDLDRRMQLWQSAVHVRQARPGPVGRLAFFALVEHCLRKAKTTPPRMLSKYLHEKYYSVITDGDEARAQRILAEYDRRKADCRCTGADHTY